MKRTISGVLESVDDELILALSAYPAFHSAHEGYAVLKEEVDELWDQVKLKQSKRDPEAMQRECIQIAAMAVRFALEICAYQDAKK